MFATQVLPETSNDSEEENISEIVGYIFVDNNKYELKRGETKIGRDSSMCSIVIENSTVSKVHAIIESEGVNDSFIYDAGSTNQTRLGKKVLKPHCRYKLDNNSMLTLGNVIAKFVVPLDKNSGPDSQSVQAGNLDDLGDIFDLPTQVGVLQSHTPSKGHEKQPQNFHIFSIPNSVHPGKAGSKICNNESLQCRTNSQMVSLTSRGLENSHIYSLGTQCQIYAPPLEQNKCIVQPVHSVDKNKITSLLDDGQDDVLCTFMSLHSPNEQSGLLKEINIKTEIEDSGQVQDAPHQVQVEKIWESVNEKESKELSEFLGKKDIIHDLSSRILCKPNVTSTPISSKRNLNHPSNISEKNDNSVEHTNEDFIKTQEFNVIHSKSKKDKQDDSPVGPNNNSQNEKAQPCFVDLNVPHTSESKNIDEDFIFTQTFELAEKDPENKKSPMVIQETEDFLETQIFSVENELRLETRCGSPKSPNTGIDTTLNFTQRNEEDDFIATQAFEETTDVKSSDRNESDEDEDFIATQKIELPVKKSDTKNYQGIASAAAAFTQSSPDLMAVEGLPENSEEDCISTQIFDGDRENPIIEIRERISSRFKENECIVPPAKVSDPESSGDETESDLEVIFEKTETTGKEGSQKFIKTELCENSQGTFSEAQGDGDSNSYIFELEPDNNSERVISCDIEQNQRSVDHSSDSDATDCEEIAVFGSKMVVKEEPKEKAQFDETRVLTLTSPNDFAEKPSGSNDDWMSHAESPTFVVESPLSLEMPNTQDIETTMNRILRKEKLAEDGNEDFVTPPKIKKTEVGINSNSIRVEPKRLTESPLKRHIESSSAEVISAKKFKTEVLDKLLRSSEIQLSKLVRAHDISQIQPGRTRNSLRNLTKETKGEVLPGNNINNERPTSRRNANPQRGRRRNQSGDITPYLTRGAERKLSSGVQKKKTSPNENQQLESSTRVLRSSTRSADKSQDTNGRKSRRVSRTKDEEYFRSSCVNVLFTGIECQILDRIIYELGGKKTNDLTSGEVVVTDKVRRTVKFLSAMGLGLPITSPEWLLSCKREKKFLNPWNYILKDEESEKKWDFELKASLEKSKKAKLLKGFSIFATKNTKPPVKDLLAIAEFCGGTPLFDSPDVWPKKTIIVSCLEDKKWWPLPKFRNIKIVHYEFILSGVLTQRIDFKSYSLR